MRTHTAGMWRSPIFFLTLKVLFPKVHSELTSNPPCPSPSSKHCRTLSTCQALRRCSSHPSGQYGNPGNRCPSSCTLHVLSVVTQPSGILLSPFHCGRGCRDVSSKQFRLKLIPVFSIPQSLRVTVHLRPLSVSITWLILSQRMAWL